MELFVTNVLLIVLIAIALLQTHLLQQIHNEVEYSNLEDDDTPERPNQDL